MAKALLILLGLCAAVAIVRAGDAAEVLAVEAVPAVVEAVHVVPAVAKSYRYERRYIPAPTHAHITTTYVSAPAALHVEHPAHLVAAHPVYGHHHAAALLHHLRR